MMAAWFILVGFVITVTYFAVKILFNKNILPALSYDAEGHGSFVKFVMYVVICVIIIHAWPALVTGFASIDMEVRK